MKNKLFRFFVIILAIASLSSSVIAVSDNNIQPRYTYISLNQADLSINTSTGTALCSASVGAGEYCTVKVEGRLQRYTDGKWMTLKSWTKTNVTAVALTRSHDVAPGYLYQFIINCYVYDSNGNLIEESDASKCVGYYL